MTTFRRTTGIVSDQGNPKFEADVIMTASLLGFTAWRLGDPADAGSTLKPLEIGSVRFDADPGTLQNPISTADVDQLTTGVERIQRAVSAYLKRANPKVSAKVVAGLAGGWSEGACIMGIYEAAAQTAPRDIAKLEKLSQQGIERWKAISAGGDVDQYTGRGAYSGFVDDPNGQVLSGPISTARFWASAAATGPERWVPALDLTKSPWIERVPAKTNPIDPTPDPFPWGMIGGDSAAPKDPKKPTAAQITYDMEHRYHMVFNDVIANDRVDVAMYTHGMIQAIYLAYGHGPSCRAYEIAVGKQTTKMASCVPCSFFMAANGYYPSSIHLGRGESWAPLFAPYIVPGSKVDPNARKALPSTIRDLNNSWFDRCLLWLKKGLLILTDEILADENHKQAKRRVADYVNNSRYANDKQLGGRLILDAISMHDSEISRVLRTLKM